MIAKDALSICEVEGIGGALGLLEIRRLERIYLTDGLLHSAALAI